MSRLKNRTFFLWWLSYMLLLLITFAVSVIVYVVSKSTFEEEIAAKYQSMLEQVQTVFDERLESVVQGAYNVSSAESVRHLAKAADSKFNPIEMEHAYYAQKALQEFILTEKGVESAWLYYPAAKMTLSNTNIYKNSMETLAAAELGISEEVLEGLSDRFQTFLPSSDNAILYAQRLVFGRTGASPCVIIVKMNPDYLANGIESFGWTSDGILKMNLAGGTLSWNGADSDAAYLEEQLSAAGGESGNEVSVVRSMSNAFQGDYVFAISNRIFLRSINRYRMIFSAYLIISLILGGAMAFLLAKAAYNPVRKIVQTFISRLGSSPYRNEFLFIEEKLKDLLAENRSIEKKLAATVNVRQSEMIRKLIRGRADGITAEDLQNEGFPFRLEIADYVVAALQVVDYGELFLVSNAEDESKENKEKELVAFLIKNVVQELASEAVVSYVEEIDEVIYCIAELERPEQETEIRRAVGRSCDFIRDNFQIGIAAAAGRVSRGIEGIGAAASDAAERVEYNVMMGVMGLAEDETADRESGSENGAFFKELNRIINMLSSGKVLPAFSVLNDFIEGEIRSGSHRAARFRLHAIALALIDSAELLVLPDGTEPEGLGELMQRLESVKTLKDLQDCARQLSLGIQRASEQKAVPDKTAEMIRYIDEHYCDSNLSLGIVADYFQVYPSTVTRSLKKALGKNPLDYIQLLRLTRAKELLQKTDKNVSEVAEMVGCYNSLTLKRIFRKYEGITPAAYREMLKS